jgi:hypothetical protein
MDDRINEAVKYTEIVRSPKSSLSTFGITNIYYYLVSQPAYTELVRSGDETVIREGRVIAERPKIVTPYYLTHLDGFSPEARRYFEALVQAHGPDVPGLFYTYKNEPGGMNIVADKMPAVIDKINRDIDSSGNPLTSIIRAQDDLWDVSLLKFIYELTRSSLHANITQMGQRGLLKMDARGIPADARARFEELFAMARSGEIEPRRLKEELDRWGVFEEYQDRFFAMFHRHS